MFTEFQQSVCDLADKLPQWNTENIERKLYSSISSMYEEAGELAGLCSKMRSRSKQFGIPAVEQDNYEKAKEKFIDESGDMLWIITCSNYCLGYNFSIISILQEAESDSAYYTMDFEQCLYDVFSSINEFREYTLDVNNKAEEQFKNIVYDFGTFLNALNIEYKISFDTILKHNMEKLGLRYDENGKRVDGK